jgi:hypothetical protein
MKRWSRHCRMQLGHPGTGPPARKPPVLSPVLSQNLFFHPKEFQMTKLLKWALLVLGMMMTLWAGTARAESQYGYNTTTSAVSAQAHVNVSVNVPRLILLRVGDTNTSINTVTFTLSASIPNTPTTATTGNDQNVNWDMTLPSFSAATSQLPAAVWTNVTGTTLACTVNAFAPATGPAATDLTFTTTGGTLAHPTCGGAGIAIVANGAVKTTNYVYGLTATNAANWPAGTYSTQITYTASAP